MNAREKIWAWIEEHRGGRVFYGTYWQIADDTGISPGYIRKVLADFADVGAIMLIKYGCRRIIFRPPLETIWPRKTYTPDIDRQIRALSAKGLTLKVMARQIGITRGVVASRRAAMGLEKRPTFYNRSKQPKGHTNANSYQR